MIVVTGAAGFIGSNIIKALNERGRSDIIAVDDLQDGHKFQNMSDCQLADYLDKDDFLTKIQKGDQSFARNIEVIFHQGACSKTTEWDGRFMMKNNYDYSKVLLHFCLEHEVPFLYASSAAVYGANKVFKENPEYEQPLNVYGYSKLLFDQYVRRLLAQGVRSQVAGFRYFNVYGPREQHKGSMASVAFHHYQQVQNSGRVKLFVGNDGYGDGEQQRDFVFVADVVAVNLWFFDHTEKSGIFNLGSGLAQSFNDIANAVIAWHGGGHIEYIPFPEQLKGCYQSFTQADISLLRAVGYGASFKTVEQGVKQYLDVLAS